MKNEEQVRDDINRDINKAFCIISLSACVFIAASYNAISSTCLQDDDVCCLQEPVGIKTIIPFSIALGSLVFAYVGESIVDYHNQKSENEMY